MLDKNSDAPYVEEKKPTKDIAWYIGRGCGALLAMCIASIVIALTIRVIMWILGL